MLGLLPTWVTPTIDRMKGAFLILLTIVAGIIGGSAEPNSELEKFAALPAADALHLYRNSNGEPEIQKEMMRAALRDKRMDLIALLFNSYPEFHDVISCLNEIPDSAFKDEVVVTLLRTQSTFWKEEHPIEYGSRGAVFDNAVEPFVGTIGRLLPAVSVDEKLFSTKASRLKLVTDLEEAIAKESAPPTKGLIRPKKKRGNREGQPDSVGFVKTQSDSERKRNDRNPNSASDQGSEPFTWWVTAGCIGLLFIACGVWLKMRKSRSVS